MRMNIYLRWISAFLGFRELGIYGVIIAKKLRLKTIVLIFSKAMRTWNKLAIYIETTSELLSRELDWLRLRQGWLTQCHENLSDSTFQDAFVPCSAFIR